jgi:tetratricopeptide (TPR) repeat protein
MNERFSDAADSFGKWAAEAEEQKPEQQFLIASAYAQAKRFGEAAPYAKKAIEGNPDAPENWYALLASLDYELKQNAELAEVLTTLTKKYPKKEHYLQLSQTYSDMGEKQKALQALETADSKGMLSEEPEFTGLALLYCQTGNAKKGSAVLEKQMKAGKVERSGETLSVLARCYISGKDAAKALATLDAAGDEIGSGQPYLELARLEAEQGNWDKARDAAARSVVKGGLLTPGEGHLVLGIAHYNTKRKDAALISLNEAKKNPAVASCAEEWIRAVKAGKPGPTCGQKPVKP